MTNLRNKHVVITGGGSGIGAAIATALDPLGVSITVIGRRLQPLQEQASKLSRAQAISCDLTCADQVKTTFAQATDQFGAIAILINNAGQAHTVPFHKMQQHQWQAMLDINLNSVFTCTHLSYPAMRAAGWGRIINIASTAALRGYQYVSAYCAAKHAVQGMTRALALEAANTGVTVNAICPGYTDTNIITEAINTLCARTGCSKEQALQTFTRTNPQGRLIKPEEIAQAVLWLCGNGSESITGQSIVIAGGEVM